MPKVGTLTLTTRGIGVTEQNVFPQNSNISRVILVINRPNTRHVGTYLNAFLMVILNMVMKFSNVDIFYKIC